tara:strand:- start:122 stop:1036 length:915 start_codon:yes stop_codon:yes gene_type:complete
MSSYNPGSETVRNFLPINTITVNLSDKCNFKCKMCDVPSLSQKQNIETESAEKYLKYASDLGVKCCIIGSGSEVTLSPNWREIVSLSLELFPDVVLFTNGSIISFNDIEWLSDLGLARIFFSLDSANKETFKIIRGYNLLEKIEKKIHHVVSYRESKNRPSPLVRVSFVKQDVNASEQEAFIQKWLGKVDSIELQDLINLDSMFVEDLDSEISSLKETNVKPWCHYPFSYSCLWSNGSVSPCCNAYGRDMIDITYANINSGKEWQSQLNENRRKLREKFLSEDWSKIPKTCQHCLVKQLKDKDH